VTKVDAILGASVLIFLVAGDVWFPPASAWQLARLPVLACALVSAAIVVAREPGILGALARPPLLFFSIFAAIDLVASAVGVRPLASLRYAGGYVAIAMLAAAVAARFDERSLVNGLFATLLAKVALSLAFAGSPDAWWWRIRFQGVLGSPNPMGAAAGLAYLLIALHGWYQWPRARARAALAGAAVLTTSMMGATQSLSAAAATAGTLCLLAPLSGLRASGWKDRTRWVGGTIVLPLLAPLIVFALGLASSHRLTTPAQSVSFRSGWWVMLVKAIERSPWLGYGAGSTPWLGVTGSAYTSTSAHNLYIEAGLYAGVPAALAMLAFVAGTCWFAVRRAAAGPPACRVGLAVPVVFYAVLSTVEPVVLNGVPSSLIVPLTAAALFAARGAASGQDADR
jgi:O-antigen ligase